MHSLIFDFDGTLINTNDLIIDTLKKVAKDKLNQILDQNKITEMFGLTIDKQMRLLDSEREEELIKYYFDLYLEKVESDTFLFKGIESLLKKLSELEFDLYIFTNNNTKDTIKSLKRLNIFKYFKDIITMDHVTIGKPNPEGLELLFKNNNLNKKETLLIGDSPHDIEAGQRFGIKTVLVGWSSIDLDSFDVKPDYIINHPNELLELV